MFKKMTLLFTCFILLSVSTCLAEEKPILVCGWMGKAWVNEILRPLDIPYETAKSSWVEPDEWSSYSAIIFTLDSKLHKLSAEECQKVSEFVNNGGNLVFGYMAPGYLGSGAGGTLDISSLSELLGAKTYGYQAGGEFRLLDSGHPLTEHLKADQVVNWPDFGGKIRFRGITTGQLLVGEPDKAALLVNKFGKGTVYYIFDDPRPTHPQDLRLVHKKIAFLAANRSLTELK